MVDKGLTVTGKVNRSMGGQGHDSSCKLSSCRAAMITTNICGKMHTLIGLFDVREVKLSINSAVIAEATSKPPNPCPAKSEVTG